MKRNTSLQFRIALIALSFVLWVGTASAQNSLDAQRGTGPVRTESKMLYHDGPVLANIQNVYFIFYGCWTDACRSGNTTAVQILNDYGATIGNSDYMGINNTYTDKFGHSATKTIFFGGEVFDGSYSHGFDLTKSDIEAIIADQILNRLLPQDSQGIYVVFAADNIAATSVGFCVEGAPPFHSSNIIAGGQLPYIFIGHPSRCPAIAGPQFGNQATPNDNFAGDAMVTTLTHALNGVLTNPFGNGWYDRYGLENADKCTGNFGTTYTTPNGARANLRLHQRDYLVEQNWVNNRKGSCIQFPY